MPKLASLRERLEREGKPSDQDITLKAARSLAKRIQGIQQMLVALSEQVGSVAGQVVIPAAPEIPNHSGDFGALQQKIDQIEKAIHGIKIPEVPEIPPYPEPKEVDLSGIIKAIAMLEEKIEGIEFPEMELEMPKRKFDLDVIRNSFGVIQKIIVTEV